MVALSVLRVLRVLGFGAYTRRMMKSVADFVAGGRLAGPYLLAVARGEMQAGAVVFVAAFEVVNKAGFTLHLGSETPIQHPPSHSSLVRALGNRPGHTSHSLKRRLSEAANALAPRGARLC